MQKMKEKIKNNRNQAKAFDIFHLLALFVHIESRFFFCFIRICPYRESNNRAAEK